jgi:hypothetical protein
MHTSRFLGKESSIAVAIPRLSGPEAAVLLVSPVRSLRLPGERYGFLGVVRTRGCDVLEFKQLAVAIADATGTGGLS